MVEPELFFIKSIKDLTSEEKKIFYKNFDQMFLKQVNNKKKKTSIFRSKFCEVYNFIHTFAGKSGKEFRLYSIPIYRLEYFCSLLKKGNFSAAFQIIKAKVNFLHSFMNSGNSRDGIVSCGYYPEYVMIAWIQAMYEMYISMKSMHRRKRCNLPSKKRSYRLPERKTISHQELIKIVSVGV